MTNSNTRSEIHNVETSTGLGWHVRAEKGVLAKGKRRGVIIGVMLSEGQREDYRETGAK